MNSYSFGKLGKNINYTFQKVDWRCQCEHKWKKWSVLEKKVYRQSHAKATATQGLEKQFKEQIWET